MGEARGQTLNRDAEQVHVDDVVVQKACSERGEIAFLDDVGVIDGEEDIGITTESGLGVEGRKDGGQGPEQGEKMAHSSQSIENQSHVDDNCHFSR